MSAVGSRARRSASFLRPGSGLLILPPAVWVLAVLVAPIVLIGLYSVNLKTNLLGVPTAFSTANWKDFLPPGSNPFWDRFKISMTITLMVSVITVVAAYPLAYFLAFVAGKRRYALLFVLPPTTGESIPPLLVGAPRSFMFGNSIQSFFTDTPNWNYGAVLALWLVAIVLVMLLLFGRYLSTDLEDAAT